MNSKHMKLYHGLPHTESAHHFSTVGEAVAGVTKDFKSICAPTHTMVIANHIYITYKLVKKYCATSKTYRRAVLIQKVQVVEHMRRKGMFTSTLRQLVQHFRPEMVLIEAVLPAGGMPGWVLSRGYKEVYGEWGNWTREMSWTDFVPPTKRHVSYAVSRAD